MAPFLSTATIPMIIVVLKFSLEMALVPRVTGQSGQRPGGQVRFSKRFLS